MLDPRETTFSPMFFWLKTISLYSVTACVACLLSVVLSVLSVLPWASDDSPGIGILWVLVFLSEATILILFSLSVTAELIQRKVLARRFRWSKALLRFLLAIPMAVGPLFAIVWVIPFVEASRPAHWREKEVILYCVSVAFAYFALRVRKLSQKPMHM
jgi:hypothetical protein